MKKIILGLVMMMVLGGAKGVEAQTGITKLYYHHSWANRPEVIQNLQPLYSAFTRAEYVPNYSVADRKSEIRAQYFEATTPPMPGRETAGYPLMYPSVSEDELNFVHMSDPANLSVFKRDRSFYIYWKADARYSDRMKVAYSVYRVK